MFNLIFDQQSKYILILFIFLHIIIVYLLSHYAQLLNIHIHIHRVIKAVVRTTNRPLWNHIDNVQPIIPTIPSNEDHTRTPQPNIEIIRNARKSKTVRWPRK